MSQVLGQSWEDWVLERGMAKGIAVGKAEGELLSLRCVLVELLTAKFQTVPAELRQRIDATKESSRLQHAVRQVLHIGSLDELEL